MIRLNRRDVTCHHQRRAVIPCGRPEGRFGFLLSNIHYGEIEQWQGHFCTRRTCSFSGIT